MKAHHKRSLMSVIVLLMSLDILAAQSQATKKSETPTTQAAPTTNQPQTDVRQPDVVVDQLLSATGQKYAKVGGVWIIRRSGTNLEFFQIVLSHRAGMLITEVFVAKGESLQLSEAAPVLLRLVNSLDSVKIGFDRDDDVFVRNEARLKSLDADGLTANIESVAAAADRTFVELRRFRKN